MCYVRNDGNIVIEIKQLIFERAGKPSESVLGRLLLYTMGFSLLSEMEFFAVPKNGISLNI